VASGQLLTPKSVAWPLATGHYFHCFRASPIDMNDSSGNSFQFSVVELVTTEN
jgi:hypothetical protein